MKRKRVARQNIYRKKKKIFTKPVYPLEPMAPKPNSSRSFFSSRRENSPHSPSLLSRRRPALRFEGSHPLRRSPVASPAVPSLELASGALEHHGGWSCAAPASGRCDRMSWWQRRRRRFVERRRRRKTLGCPAAELPPPHPPLGVGDGPDRGAVVAAASFAAPSHRSATGAEEPRQHLLPQQRPPVPRLHASPCHVLPRLAPLQSVYETLVLAFPFLYCSSAIRQAVDVFVGLFACRQEGIPKQGQGVFVLCA